MLFLLSPAKKQDFSEENFHINSSLPIFEKEIKELLEVAKEKSENDLQDLMKISEKLAKLNYTRFKDFTFPFNNSNSKQAIASFKGDVYTSLELAKYNKEQYSFLQNNFRIISGLYGLLRPLDLIQPYRLEMGIPLANNKGKDLYAFWKNKLAKKINIDILEYNHEYIINLASNEYWKAIDSTILKKPVITIFFKENRDGSLKTIALNAKRARSMISNFIIQNKITSKEDLKEFSENDYKFDSKLSSDSEYFYIK